jgi:hypothetical protein
MTKGKKKNPELARLMDRQALTLAYAPRRKEVDLPEGGSILVQEFIGPSYLAYQQYFEWKDVEGKPVPQWTPEKRVNLYKFVTHLCAINPDGTRMFPDFETMPDLRADVLKLCYDSIMELSFPKEDEVNAESPNASSSTSPKD